MLRSVITKLTLGFILLSAVAWTASAQSSEPPLTNASIVKLVRAGFKEKTVIAIIQSRPNRFNLDPDRLIDLKRNGVNENIILAMLSQNDSFMFSEDDWSAESVLGGGRKGGQPGGADIFGNNSGSKSQGGGRGQAGGNDTETSSTGSATVRILRPPAEEAGGAASIKLERTATLNNEAVIKLVEAGFSEGTIIKRIEESPAEFDLSVAKLEELRRRRVTEPIIVAMTAAMDDGSKPLGSTSNPSRTKGN